MSDKPSAGEPTSAPGWDAIDAACSALYGAQQPTHVGYWPPRLLSANLQGCSAYAALDHWHYVTYGLSELYIPERNDDPEYSGWGFELTMRVVREPAEPSPPAWPFTILNEVANYVNTRSVILAPGRRINFRVAVTGHPRVGDAPPTQLTAFAIALDPQLGRIETPSGRVEFLQLVGITGAELDEMGSTSTRAVLARRQAGDPLMVLRP